MAYIVALSSHETKQKVSPGLWSSIVCAAANMQLPLLFYTSVLAPSIGLAAPVAQDGALSKRENLCNLPAPPALCQPDPSVTVEETAKRAYAFYRSFVVDGDPRTMFSLIDSTYTVRRASLTPIYTCGDMTREENDVDDNIDTLNAWQQHHPGYASGPQTIWPIFCSGNKLGSEASTAWCFVAATNMSYARYSTTDRWRWVDGCVHEHVSSLHHRRSKQKL